MDRLTIVFLLLSPLVFESKGKTINPFEINSNEIKRRVVLGENAFREEDNLKRHEVRPIVAGYNHQHFRKNNRPASRTRRRRCFCGLSPGASCPNGYLETHIQWNDLQVDSLVPPHFPAEGPPYDVGDEWAWVQDNYDGDLQQNEYGWNWKERLNGNNEEGPQLGGYPCGQQGWCCKLIGKRCKLH